MTDAIETSNSERVEFRPSRKSNRHDVFGFVLVVLILGGAAAAILYFSLNELLLIPVALLLYWYARSFRKTWLIRNDPLVVLDHAGIRDRRFSFEPIAWSSIRSCHFGKHYHVQIEVADVSRLSPPAGWLTRFLSIRSKSNPVIELWYQYLSAENFDELRRQIERRLANDVIADQALIKRTPLQIVTTAIVTIVVMTVGVSLMMAGAVVVAKVSPFTIHSLFDQPPTQDVWDISEATRQDLRLERTFPDSFESRRFKVFHHGSVPDLPETFALMDDLHDYFSRSILPIPEHPKGKVIAIYGYDSYQSFLKALSGLDQTFPKAFYIPAFDLIALQGKPDLKIVQHEVVHALVDWAGLELPLWADEGIPSLFEKMISYRAGDARYIDFGFPISRRIEDLSYDLPGLDLKAIVNADKDVFGHSEKWVVASFLKHRHALPRYLDLVKNGRKDGYRTFFEAAVGETFAESEAAWRRFVEDMYAERFNALDIKNSSFASKTEYETYLSNGGDPIPWVMKMLMRAMIDPMNRMFRFADKTFTSVSEN